METKRESKLNYLKEKCKSTKDFIIRLDEQYLEETNKYLYEIMIYHKYHEFLRCECLRKKSTNYKYLIKLYHLFIKDDGNDKKKK